MIDVRYSESEKDLDPVFVVAPTGMLIGVFWGSRFEICQAIDEIMDPNGCKYRGCESGGIQLGCFRGDEEVSLAAYSDLSESTADDEIDLRFEGLSDTVAEGLDATELEWLPIVPPGYRYSAGVGLTKVGTDWN